MSKDIYDNSKIIAKSLIQDKEDVVYINTHTHTMEYNSAIKKNEIMPFAATWIDLEIIILSEIKEKDKYTSLICGI